MLEVTCQWCGRCHNTTANVVWVGDAVVCNKCYQDFQAEMDDEAEYQAGLAAQAVCDKLNADTERVALEKFCSEYLHG